MLKVKNGVVKITGTRDEAAYDLQRLLANLLFTTRLDEEAISEILDLAVKEKNLRKGIQNEDADPYAELYGELDV